jgi:transposase
MFDPSERGEGMSRVDRAQLQTLWADHALPVKEIAAICGVSLAYISKIKREWRLPDRPHGLAQCYSAGGPPIGADPKHLAEVERCRRFTDDELARLRACASRPSYG